MKRFEIMIDTAIKESISDIHITGEHPVVSRKNGDIQFHGSLKWTHQEIDDLIRKLLTPLQLDKLRQNDLHTDIEGKICALFLLRNVRPSEKGERT